MKLILIVIVSFFLEATFSIYEIPFLGYSLFTLVAILLCRYYWEQEKQYYIFCFCIGLLYDVAWTNTLLFHSCLFLATGFCFQKLILIFSERWYSFILTLILSLFFYRVLSYGVLILVGYKNWNWTLFLQVFFSSFLLNIIYGWILYGIIKPHKYVLNKWSST